MRISVEMSYYPLNEQYIEPIKNFIERVKANGSLEVTTNGMSTQIFGEYDAVMGTIIKEMKQSFEVPHSVFVMKVINSDLRKIPTDDSNDC
jgi:uncharacterized protein YqgV (UPF0045/DUF77 family)